MVTAPVVGRSSPLISRANVVLPEPFSPMMPMRRSQSLSESGCSAGRPAKLTDASQNSMSKCHSRAAEPTEL